MGDVSKIFKPRRGLKSTMASNAKKGTVLSSGEFFVEAPDTGVGTGQHKIKIGDGTTAYSDLPYALGDTSNDKIEFSSNTATTVANALNSVASGQSLKTIIGGLKQAISLCNTSITQLNDDTAKINIYVGDDGKLHFVDRTGADSVLPFSPDGDYKPICFQYFGINSSSEKFILPKGMYILETLCGCFSSFDNVPYVYLYKSDGTLLYTASRTVLYNTSYNNVPFSILHSSNIIILENDTEVYLHHSQGNFSQFAKSILTNYDPNITISLVQSIGGEAFCGSYYPECEAYRAFDNYTGGSGWSSGRGNIDNYIGYKFKIPVKVKSVKLLNTGYGSQQAKSFVLQGSNDGVNYENLTETLYGNLDQMGEKTFDINNDKKYLYYRIHTLTSNGSEFVSFREIYFYGTV